MNANKFTWEEAVEWLRLQPDKQDLVRDCYYDDPIELVAERFEKSEEWSALKTLLANYLPGKVLDLGAGRGISSFAFSKNGCKVTALEPDGSLLVGAGAIKRLAGSTGVDIEVVQDYGETLPFEGNSFDIVYGRAVLHHAHDLGKLCQEAYRVLRPGGIFIATREHVVSKKEDLPTFFENHDLHYLYGGENALLLSDYKASIIKAGFKLFRVIPHYESVINYAPVSREQFRARLQKKLAKISGKKLADWLVDFNFLQNVFGWYLSKIDNTPGRLYSFMAKKP